MYSSQYDQSDTFTEYAYREAFINDLYNYIPHLKELICIGGEPFLINYYYDIWEEIIRVNPSCRISVVTNGTILNDKIKELLDRGNFNINLSFESIVKETYEKIRVNANFDTVISNMNYFGQILKSQGKTLQIPACALKDNCKEIPDLVRFCNEKSYHLSILTTHRDIDDAAWSLSSYQLKELKDYYLMQTFTAHDWNSNDNVANFKNFITTIDRWILDAERKENFQNIFDLKTDNVSNLKNKLFSNIEKCLKEISLSEDDFCKKSEYVFDKWKRIMDILPEYFESNHLYEVLLQVSPFFIVEYMLRCNSNTMSKILEEGFYYGYAH
jgi:MoaA/NifB/PqqE/SkfB family radical SAM enzyme